jgi:hypothetical protein
VPSNPTSIGRCRCRAFSKRFIIFGDLGHDNLNLLAYAKAPDTCPSGILSLWYFSIATEGTQDDYQKGHQHKSEWRLQEVHLL